MRVLLINPNSSLINKNWAYKKFFTPIAPLGLAYLAGILKKNGFEVSIIDQFADKMPDAVLLNIIKDRKPDVIGFSALTPVIRDVRRLALAIKELSGKSKIVLGNIHATCFPQEVLSEGTADIVVRGEGENTLVELCQRLSRNKGLEGLPGISFKIDGQIVHNPEREVIADLDSLPYPAWEELNLDNYTEVPLVAIKKARAFPIIASRGCDFRCYYCSQDKIYKQVRYRNLNKVIDEMEYFYNNHGIKIFGFSDAYFPFDETSGLEFCASLIKRNLNKKIEWCTETRVDKVTPRLLEAMKEAGVHLIMYGVEVGNQRIMDSLNKGTTLEQARFALQQTRKAGILSQGLFILGLPGESIRTCKDTINFAKELDCDLVKFNVAMPYPGSRFFEDYKRMNKISNPERFTSWFDWVNFSEDFIYTPQGMDSNILRYLQRRAMLEFYARPKVILRHLLRGTIRYENILYGGFWLLSLFYSGVLKRLKLWISNKYPRGKKWNFLFPRIGKKS
ncbi:MAG: radical SAM protein [Candidatus Omnitrophota bacterium]